MPLTLLLDLDDTLLGTNLSTFMPAYFQALCKHLSARVPGDEMLRALIGGMSRMADNDDPRCTLEDVFDSYFYRKVGLTKDELRDSIEDFYERVFPTLAGLTTQLPEAVKFIEWAELCGYRIAIATDPLFPMQATRHRLRWAGFDPDQFELVSAYEDFHFSKASPAYYAEILGRLGWQDGPVLMVGNDPGRDILSAHRLGLKTFFIEGESTSNPGVEAGSGQLPELRGWLESIELSELEPAFKSRDAILGILTSTPAVLQHLVDMLPEEELKHELARDDWAINEILSHLRDTEREVHALQIDLLLEKSDSFIPRPDTGVWASERDYLAEDAHLAVSEFANARVALLDKLKNLPDEMWSRKARHAIFGPTHFQEVLSFAADHDRLHLQQAWKIMRTLLGERV
jgi:FMN phosphatase YigB (HAD superfamily)